MKRLVRLCLIAVLAASCFGCESKEEDSSIVPHLTREMKTYCVGRYLIELPASFRRVHLAAGGAGDATFYFGHGADFRTVDVTVLAHPVSPESFKSAVAQRAGELAAGINYETNGTMLLGNQTLEPGQVELIYHASAEIADAQVHELHLLVDDAYVAINTTAFDAAQVQTAQRRLRDMVGRIRGAADPASAGRGVCLGPVSVDAGSDYEEMQLGFRAVDHAYADIRLQISINTFLQADDEPSLIARGESNLAGLGVSWKTLRKGRRPLAGMDGEQWLGRFEEAGKHQHGFYAETNTRTPSARHPKLMLELLTGGENDYGGPMGSSLDDEQAAALWDLLLDSLRVRTSA